MREQDWAEKIQPAVERTARLAYTNGMVGNIEPMLIGALAACGVNLGDTPREKFMTMLHWSVRMQVEANRVMAEMSEGGEK